MKKHTTKRAILAVQLLMVLAIGLFAYMHFKGSTPGPSKITAEWRVKDNECFVTIPTDLTCSGDQTKCLKRFTQGKAFYDRGVCDKVNDRKAYDAPTCQARVKYWNIQCPS